MREREKRERRQRRSSSSGLPFHAVSRTLVRRQMSYVSTRSEHVWRGDDEDKILGGTNWCLLWTWT